MVGYSLGYRLWSIDKKKIIMARDVVFKEDEFGLKIIL